METRRHDRKVFASIPSSSSTITLYLADPAYLLQELSIYFIKQSLMAAEGAVGCSLTNHYFYFSLFIMYHCDYQRSSRSSVATAVDNS
jgi:hypothetical protein